ncbi:unnamed protein product, partial [Staurois parvus]
INGLPTPCLCALPGSETLIPVRAPWERVAPRSDPIAVRDLCVRSRSCDH